VIIPSQGLRIVLAVCPVDFRCGHDALAALVQNKLELDPHPCLIVGSARSERIA
jgi:transposase